MASFCSPSAAASARRPTLPVSVPRPPQVSLAFFSVVVSFCYSNGLIQSTSLLGFAGLGLALLPITLLPLPSGAASTSATIAAGPSLSEPLVPAKEAHAQSEPASNTSASGGPRSKGLKALRTAAMAVMAVGPTGVRFADAARGLDFWLLFLMQLAVFGACASQRVSLLPACCRLPALFPPLTPTRFCLPARLQAAASQPTKTSP